MPPLSSAEVTLRNRVTVSGNPDGPPMVFVHGFGGSQESWSFVAPEFEADYRVVVFDHVGAGSSDLAAYNRGKYDSLHGYADDIIEVIESLGLRDVICVGHSVGGMMCILAANRRPDLISRLILLGPSPRYIDTEGYAGGFSQQTVDDLLAALDSNFLGFSAAIGTTLMGNPDRPELGMAYGASVAAVDPSIAAQFARVTFLSDNRRDLADVTVPTLILQSAEDDIANLEVGKYVHAHIPHSEFVVMPTRGHIPNLSHPAEVTRHIRSHLT
jgi:sigma-B regulation protein RsbQ